MLIGVKLLVFFPDNHVDSNYVFLYRKNNVISRLDLSNNMTGFDGGQKYADVIKMNTTLTHLSLRHNKITDRV